MKSSHFRIIIGVIVLGFICINSARAQESILKRFAKSKTEKQYTFYASTLRMLDISKDKNLHEFVNDVEKVNIFLFDSITIIDQSYLELSDMYSSEGFDEYMSMQGGKFAYLAGKEKGREMELVCVFGQKDFAMGVYLVGSIPLQKIPTLIETINKMELLDLLDLDF
jgi:hypothetical protein